MFEEREENPQHWSSKTFKLNRFLEHFQLPQTIKVVEGVFSDEEDQETVCINDILIFHNCEQIRKVKITDSQEETASLPLSCDTKVTRVAAEFAQSRLSGRDILKYLSKVLFVRILDGDANNGLERNEKFRIDYDSVQNHGESFSFVLESITEQTKRVKITQNCQTHFQPILDPTEYNISEIVKKFGLPQHVLFVDSINSTLDKSTQTNDRAENGRILTLESTFTESIVNASNILEPKTLFHLQTNLELVVCATLDAELQGMTSKASKMISQERQSEKDIKDANLVIYEDMTSHALIQTTSLETLGKTCRQGQSLNAYTPPPLRKTNMTTFHGKMTSVSHHPHETPKHEERGSENVGRSSENWYDVPKSHHAETCEGTAKTGRLKQVDGEDKDHIYQEIDFRELFKAKKDHEKTVSVTEKDKQGENASASARKNLDTLARVSSNRKSTYYNITKHLSFKKQTHDTAARSQNNYKLDDNDSESTSKSTDFNQKTTQESGGVYRRAVSTICCSENTMWAQHNQNSTSQRSQSVGCLEGTSSITEALAKHRLFASKSEKTVVVPPLPPPRSSSMKPVAEAEMCAPPGEKHLPGDPPSNQEKHPVDEFHSLNEKASKLTGNNGFNRKQQPSTSSRMRSVSVPHVHEAKIFKNRDGEFSDAATSPKEQLNAKPINVRSVSVPHVLESKIFKNRAGEFSDAATSPKEQLNAKPMHVKVNPIVRPDFPSRSKTDLHLDTKSTKSLKPPIKSKPDKLKTVQGHYNSLPRQKPPEKMDSFTIPDDLQSLSVSGVCECLERLNLETLVEFFKHNLIDGEMLMALDDDTMAEMGIERFHRLKLKKFIDGWRPSL